MYFIVIFLRESSMLRAQDIQLIENNRRSRRKETYKYILESFDKKIRNCVQLGISHVLLEVPSFVFGYPFFDHEAAIVYLKRQLENLGYKVTRTDHVFVVTWARAAPISEHPEPDSDEGLPSLMNLRKIASKIIQQDRNGGRRRSS
jgi:hypothetical protein